jgi:hypothetical protein
MFFLKLDRKNFYINEIADVRCSKNYFNNLFRVFFVGNFRTPIEEIDKLIKSFKNQNFSNDNILKIFKIIDGSCALIISNNKEIKICQSIQNTWLKIFKNNEEFIITENENYNSKELSQNNSFLKLFSHHSYFFHSGISKDVIDFICPGSVFTFSKKTKNYEFSWYLNFEEFCSKDNHEEIAKDLAESFINIFNNLDKEKKYYIALSGGIDSALILAAANKKITVQPIHEGRGIHADELQTAKNTSSFFKKNLKVFYPFNKKLSLLDSNTDIIEFLNFSYKFIKKDSVYFFLDSAFQHIYQNFKDGHIFTGDAFPTLLTLNHMMVYPTRKNRNMHYGTKKNDRFFYSIKFFEELKNKPPIKDFWDFGKNFPEIHPYYYLVLSAFIDQEPKCMQDYLNANLSFDSIPVNSPIIEKSKDTKNHIKKFKMINAHKIIHKILKSDFLKKNLKNPDARTAQILLKLVRLLGRTNKANHQAARLNNENLVYECAGLNSKIQLKLLSTIIDDKLVQNSKWHVFRAFEIITGKKFEELFYVPTFKDFKYVFKRINLILFAKIKNLPEYNDLYALINNKSLKKFVKDNKIIDKYEAFKLNHEYKELLYDYPKDKDLSNINKLNSNHWKINNIINIVNKL